jgi:hypothetical protein
MHAVAEPETIGFFLNCLFAGKRKSTRRRLSCKQCQEGGMIAQ